MDEDGYWLDRKTIGLGMSQWIVDGYGTFVVPSSSLITTNHLQWDTPREE